MTRVYAFQNMDLLLDTAIAAAKLPVRRASCRVGRVVGVAVYLHLVLWKARALIYPGLSLAATLCMSLLSVFRSCTLHVLC